MFGTCAPSPASICTSTAPTGTTEPASATIFLIVPRTGLVIGTVALSVITSTSSWSSVTESPSATIHFTISPSATPSPMSGSGNSKRLLTWGSPRSAIVEDALERAHDPLGVGHVNVLQRVRERSVEAGDAQDRCAQGV